MDRDEVEIALQGRGIWARDDGFPERTNRCGSAKGTYRSPPGEDDGPRTDEVELPDHVGKMIDSTIAALPVRVQNVLLGYFVREYAVTTVGGQLVLDPAVRAVADRLCGSPDLRRRADRQSAEGSA